VPTAYRAQAAGRWWYGNSRPALVGRHRPPAKVAQEHTLLEGPLPVRIVRAAQFHEFVGPLVGWTIQDGVAYVPEMRTQLVAARVVAETLADAAEEPEIESGRITEVAGPQVERLADAAAALFASRGDSIEIREGRGGPLADPGDPDAAAYAEGAALPNPGAKLAGPSFEEWLAAAVGADAPVG
jgi:uncharacterized protein YbjT (DUF2867 family)